MNRRQLCTGILATTVLGLLGLSLVASSSSVGQAQPAASVDAVVPMPENLWHVEVTLGVGDEEQKQWEGSILVSAGRVVESKVVRAGRDSTADAQKFSVKALKTPAKKGKNAKKKKAADQLEPAVVRYVIDAPPEARVALQSTHGNVEFALRDVAGKPATFLDGRVGVDVRPGAVRLTGRNTEDDYPVLAKGKDGRYWLAYVEYTLSRPILTEQLQNRDFDSLVPQGNGDRIRLRSFDGKTWQTPIDVTDGGLDVWRPTVAVDAKGKVAVAWSQKLDDDWEILARTYDPAASKWSAIERITKQPGSDFQVVSTTDSRGTVWLAWQAWRDGKFEINVQAVGTSEPKRFGTEKANCWGPALTADSKGRVYLAYDHYLNGNYDVQLQVIEGDRRTSIAVANSARFEARASLACDQGDRVWIAYELGDEQWGKDFVGNEPSKVGLKANPGFGLYVNRKVELRCLAAAGDSPAEKHIRDLKTRLEQSLASSLPRNWSVPRLCIDGAGRLWLSVRHHINRDGGGEAWDSFATYYTGSEWSAPLRLPNSSNLLDNRPALAPVEAGLLAVYSSDTRVRTQDRDQDDLFATIVEATGSVAAPALADQKPEPAAATLKPADPNEPAHIKRIRDYRVDYQGKQLRLLRGEFHRHTEYTAHRDGDGLLEDSLRYGLDAGALDWMGNGDHDNGSGHEYQWWKIQKAFDLVHNPGFVGALSYERSVSYPSGHRNVMFPKRGIRPLPRLTGDPLLYGTPEAGSPDIKLFYAYLKHFGAICASHTSATNMGTDWRDNDPAVEPVVEIYQGHRHSYEHFGAPRSATQETNIGGYQPAGFIWNALEKGYRLGFQSSSDHVSTHLSYGVVLTSDLSRQGIIDGFKRRHCYAATDNIVLVVRCGKSLMGDELETRAKPTLDITVLGTAPIAKLHVVRDNRYIYTAEPNQPEVTTKFTDMEPVAGKASYYYVRVEQADANVAWASPLWITYKP